MVNKSESAVDNPEFLLEATKFDDSNLEKDVEESVALMCRKNRWRQKYQKPKGVAGAPTGYVNGIGRGKRRFSTDENYDDVVFPSSPRIKTISEDLNEMKIKIKSCLEGFSSKDHLHPGNLYNRSSRTRKVVNTPW